MVWDQTEETTKLVREFLAKRIPPAARHNALVGPDWLRCGQGQYLVHPELRLHRLHGAVQDAVPGAQLRDADVPRSARRSATTCWRCGASRPEHRGRGRPRS